MLIARVPWVDSSDRLQPCVPVLDDLEDEAFLPTRLHMSLVIDGCISANRLPDAERIMNVRGGWLCIPGMHWALVVTLRVCMVLCSAQRFLKRGIALNTRTFNRLLAAQVAGNNIGKMCVHGCGAASVFIAS